MRVRRMTSYFEDRSSLIDTMFTKQQNNHWKLYPSSEKNGNGNGLGRARKPKTDRVMTDIYPIFNPLQLEAAARLLALFHEDSFPNGYRDLKGVWKEVLEKANGDVETYKVKDRVDECRREVMQRPGLRRILLRRCVWLMTVGKKKLRPQKLPDSKEPKWWEESIREEVSEGREQLVVQPVVENQFQLKEDHEMKKLEVKKTVQKKVQETSAIDALLTQGSVKVTQPAKETKKVSDKGNGGKSSSEKKEVGGKSKKKSGKVDFTSSSLFDTMCAVPTGTVTTIAEYDKDKASKWVKSGSPLLGKLSPGHSVVISEKGRFFFLRVQNKKRA